MIFHIAELDNDFTLREFVKHWHKPLARKLQTINTYQLGLATRMPRGTYLFTDLERQSPLLKELQAQIFEQLKVGGSRPINHPGKALGRMSLIQRFHELGINSYRAFRAIEAPRDLRFPVFLRMERDHAGVDTPLIGNWAEYEEAVVRLVALGRRPEELIAIEYCDARNEEGLFVKYGAYRIGERIVPRGVYFSNEWMVKAKDKTPTWRGEEKWAYVRTNPHEADIRRAFEIANIEYGRCDYGLCDGKIEFWEINTNPSFAGPVESYSPEALEHQSWVAEQVGAALEALDTVPSGDPIPVQIRWEPELVSR